MPSPFPGMDPFLEAPEFFGGFHKLFMVFLVEKLQGQLPPPYYADTGERIWIEYSKRHIDPDANIHRHHGTEKNGLREYPRQEAAMAVATVPVVIKVLSDPHKETFVKIFRDEGKRQRLVCTVEMLSPINKKPGEKGQGLYLQKQQEILDSKTHLVEMDFLRSGKHTTALPLDRAREIVGEFDYHVCCHRYDRRNEFLFYPIRLQNPLPTVGFPLLAGDPDVPIDLQDVFNRTYNAGPYQVCINYKKDKPGTPLKANQKKWLNQLLKEKGILS